ncbi:MAG: hypothetical protein ACO3LE_08720 [Bdellovibrionota bacterium]
MKFKFHQQRRAQTILEYFLMLLLFAAPMGFLMRDLLEDSEEEASDNIFRSISDDSYGKKNDFGIIGRPYP